MPRRRHPSARFSGRIFARAHSTVRNTLRFRSPARKTTTTIRHALLHATCLMLRSEMTIFSMATVFVGVRALQSSTYAEAGHHDDDDARSQKRRALHFNALRQLRSPSAVGMRKRAPVE